MKILHIFGAVVAVHLAVFLVIFAVPGCRTTSKSPNALREGDAPPVGTNAPVGDASPLTPAPVGAGAGDPAPTVAFPASQSVRYSPTRPNSPMAAAVQPAAPTGVTPATTYVVVKGDSLWKVAQKHHLTVAELAAANGLNPNAPLKLGQKLMIVAKTSAPSGASGAVAGGGGAAEPSGGPVHDVKSGESLSVIAKMHGTTTGTLRRLNHLKSDKVVVGQKLALPEVSASVTESTASRSVAASSVSGGTVKHVVKTGETLGAIARRYGVSRNELGLVNNITDPLKLRAGQELVIPGVAAPKTAPPAPTPAPGAPPAETVPSLFQPVTDPVAPPVKDAVPTIQIEDSPPAAPAKPQ